LKPFAFNPNMFSLIGQIVAFNPDISNLIDQLVAVETKRINLYL
jgi:hypothetical protein